jgi:hypothetical protein
LNELTLAKTPITDKGLKRLDAIPNLGTIHLDGTNVTLEGVRELMARLPRLDVTF